jgi:hypothetical protein
VTARLHRVMHPHVNVLHANLLVQPRAAH